INRVTIESVNGQPFSLTDTYAVVTNNFCAAGGDTYYAFAAASAQFDTGIPLDEAVIDYVQNELHGTIGSKYAAPRGDQTIIK
ncbi:MAG: 5'-nucleotidase C-terminal domain-containing protein, partial [Butyrivibrio sp.]|nr:5'-nucleotidase C-terminal domain-containing protein [Butyrivibrio sp.]